MSEYNFLPVGSPQCTSQYFHHQSKGLGVGCIPSLKRVTSLLFCKAPLESRDARPLCPLSASCADAHISVQYTSESRGIQTMI